MEEIKFKLFKKPLKISIEVSGNIIFSAEILEKYKLQDYEFVHLYFDYRGYQSWDNVIGIAFIDKEDDYSYPIIREDDKIIIEASDFVKNYDVHCSDYRFNFTFFEDKPMLFFDIKKCLSSE